MFAVVHFYWARGGTVGLAVSAGADLARERPTWFVVGGLYGVALVLLAAAGLGVVLARGPRSGRAGRWLPLLGAGVGAVLVVRAVGVEALLLTNPGYGGGAVSAEQRRWTLALWNPWFLVGGVAFLLAALAARRASRRLAG